MRDEALALVEGIEDPASRLNRLREYVQVFVLRSLHECEAFSAMAFVGGTALRFLENLPRFSEDLDFSVTNPSSYKPRRWLEKVRGDLELAGFEPRVTWNERRTVHVGWVRVAELLAQAGLSARPEQNLSIKLEIDSRPPKGAEVVATVITRHMTFAVRHHALSSLMAGKVHALITRGYAKGRDWFDLVWYRSHRPPVEPNTTLLQNALDQTLADETRLDAAHWKAHIRARLETLDVDHVIRDVYPFLERRADRALLSRETIEGALR